MINKYRDILSGYLGTKNIYFHKKGRVSLYAILKAMNVGKGDQVIIPAYTCVVVPNAVIYLEAIPVYVDINPETFNMDAGKLEAAITDKTKVIICQNTYGLSTEIDSIVETAKKRKIFTIEDCTHGFGGTYKGKPNGTFCDAAFFSTQWNKPFSTGIGGFALINNPELAELFIKVDKEKSKPGARQLIILKILFQVRKLLMNDTTYHIMVKFYRWLSKNNLIVGSSSGEEIRSVEKPKNYFTDFSNTQAKEGIKNLKYLNNLLKIRKENANIYSEFLEQNNKTFVEQKYFKDHSFLKYPILVSDRKVFLENAEKENIAIGDWFISSLHPVEVNLDKWNFDKSKFPVSTNISNKVVNLPSDSKNPDKILKFLKNNLYLIE